MKKVLVLVALATLVSASVYAAGIKGTKHDLSSTGGGDIKVAATTEICVFCHTPHGASASTKYTPLWNRTDTANPTANYNSSSYSQNAATDVITTDAYLCLSCHDGVQQVGALNNQPNSGTVVGATNVVTGTANLGTDLSNDHPIGFVYSTAQTADGAANLIASPVGITFAAGGEMWCSTCHDVHNNTNGQFLAINNAGSNLCLACHNK